MRLEALTAGIGANPSSLSGTIHSVFVQAANIELQSGGLLSLAVREVGALPNGFQVATPPRFSFADFVRGGERAVCRGGILRIAGSPLLIDLRCARPWRSALREHPIDWARAASPMCWCAAWNRLVEHRGAATLARWAGAAISALCGAAQRLDPAMACGPASQLIGLGDGLTPAGDDFLVGFLAGLWSLPEGAQERHAFRAAFAAHILGNAHRTGAISRVYLDAAAVGEVSERLAAVTAAIGRGDRSATLCRVAAALAVGATSGAAAVYGVLLAVRTAMEPADPVPLLSFPRRE